MIRSREPRSVESEAAVKRALAGIAIVVLSGAVWTSGAWAAPKKGQGGATSAPSSQPAKPKKVKIGEIDKSMVGQWVSVRAKILKMIERPSRTREQITIITLHEGESTIEVVYWADTAKKIPADQKPAEGDNVRVVGKVSEYRGRLQIAIEGPEGIKKLKPKKAKGEDGAGDAKGKGDD